MLNINRGQLFTKVNLGISINTILDTKLTIEYVHENKSRWSNKDIQYLEASFSWFNSQNLAFVFNTKHVKNNSFKRNEFGFNVVKYF